VLTASKRYLIVSTQDLELALDGERRAVEEARQVAALLERKRIALQTELDDVRAMLEAVSCLCPVSFVSSAEPCDSCLQTDKHFAKTVYTEIAVQESCAIAKMTAQCAPYMGALKIFGTI